MNQLKEKITTEICSFIKQYEAQNFVKTVWGQPLVGFADAKAASIQRLPETIAPNHLLPQQILPDASIILVYYVPFTRALAQTNRTGNNLASPEWAIAYEQTNAMFRVLNPHMIQKLEEWGYQGAVTPKAGTFDKDTLLSEWSVRDIAYAAGLGTFGINNMLITKEGCCGRYNSIVTNLDVEADAPAKEEYCLYKKDGSCAICLKHCPVQALTPDSFDRNKCHGNLLKNAAVYTDFGVSYVSADGKTPNSIGSDVCGKCITQSPCAFWSL